MLKACYLILSSIKTSLIGMLRAEILKLDFDLTLMILTLT